MGAIRLSFVVPVYNTAAYLVRCLDSLVNQNLSQEEYEIILINDGSTDDSAVIIGAYVDKHANIQTITQTNQGLSVSRNHGMLAAKGKYIWHIDSDDWIVENCIRELIGVMDSNNLDMLQVGPSAPVTKYFSSDMNTSGLTPVTEGKKFLNQKIMAIGTWAYIQRREFIEKNHLGFMPGLANDDIEFTPRALYYAKKVQSLNFSVYNYFIREGSIMNTFDVSRLAQWEKIAVSLKQFGQVETQSRAEKQYFFSTSNGLVISILNKISNLPINKSFTEKIIRDLHQNKLLPLILETSSLKRVCLILLINLSPRIYLRIYRSK